MEVAVGVDRFDFITLAESKADLRLFAGMHLLALIALLGLERYPLDVVLGQHGMLHRADLNMDDAVFHRPDGDVLLHGGVGGAGDDLAHRLTATDNGNARVLDLGNDVTGIHRYEGTGVRKTEMATQYRKAYVPVTPDVDKEGAILPRLIWWDNGVIFQIDQILHKCRASSNKVGGGGIRYTVMIRGKESFLFHEGNKWFVEAKEDNCS